MKFFMPIMAVAGAASLTLASPAFADSGHGGAAAPDGSAGAPAPAAHPTTTHEGMMAPGLTIPSMDAANGRALFASKGCVVCHSVNGVGGEDAAPLDSAAMPEPMMNPFDFVARMWRGAEAMIMMQQEELGGQIEFTGDELSDIVAFVHDADEQKKFSQDDIPAEIRELIAHADGDEGGKHAEEPQQ